MTRTFGRLRWFFASEEELISLTAASNGTIAKVEIVTPPEWTSTREAYVFCLSYFDAKIISPDSILDWWGAYGKSRDAIHRIHFALPIDYFCPPIDKAYYDVTQIINGIKIGTYYTLLLWTERNLVINYVID